MKNFKITIEYDGTNYSGWQRQKDNKKLPTIQGAIENSLQRIFNKRISIIGSGRTDTGVHAQGQVASFKVNTNIPLWKIPQALNTYLPEDIIVKEVKEVPESFNARFSAKKKWYRYTVYASKLASPLRRYYAARFPYPIDIDFIKAAGKMIKGQHNFSAIVLGRDIKDKVREIYKVSVSQDKEFIYFDIVGNGFLYKMVRRLVWILIEAGRNKISQQDVKQLLSGKKIDCEVQTAPAKGLTLMKVYY